MRMTTTAKYSKKRFKRARLEAKGERKACIGRVGGGVRVWNIPRETKTNYNENSTTNKTDVPCATTLEKK